MDLHSMLCGSLVGGEFGGEWMHVYVIAESLHCSPAATTSLTVYNPIQDKKFEVFFKKEGIGSVLK